MNVAESVLQVNTTALGAHPDGDGVQFSLYSAHAEKVELCLFEPGAALESRRIPLSGSGDGLWREHLTGLAAGTLYGYRVHGPWAPEAGHRFNPAKLLLDPYARRIDGDLQVDAAHYGHVLEEGDDTRRDDRDSAPFTPRCVVVDPAAPPRPLREAPRDRVIYEAHIRGLTITHEGLGADIRGTFAGLSDQRVIEYLRALGITSVELMPVQYAVDEPALQSRGLRNYWGYNTIGFFALAHRYSASGQPAEFREMVDRLHDAGIEVILDVVYNHSGEGDHLGPTLGFRGIDNASYYRLLPDNPRFYVNDTGCGNTMDVAHPQVRALVLDSLRYWVSELGVDGFRFDLATTLAREDGEYRADSRLFQAIESDPVLSQSVLIAEPWDIGPGGYRLGEFPGGWSEWNDRYRDTLRRYWRGDTGMLPELARRLHGSGDIYEESGRRPAASINFVSSHDGFTLADVVSYEQRHNEANGENNRDGHEHNFSFNCGVEGCSTDMRVLALRRRQRRNLLASLLLSQGTPMLLSGDEVGRSQRGNNNAYCQDNTTSWFNWQDATGEEQDFLSFTRYLVGLRRQHPLLGWPDYIHDSGCEDDVQCRWYNSDGELMNAASWDNEHQAWLGKMLSAPGEDALLIMLNSSGQNIPFRLAAYNDRNWKTLLDTANQDYTGGGTVNEAGGHVLLRQRSLQFFKAVTNTE